MQYMQFQYQGDKLSPHIFNSKSNRKVTMIQAPQASKKVVTNDFKLLRLLKWDNELKQIKLCADYKKCNSLFRTGPASFIVYVAYKSNRLQLQKNNIQNMPLIDTNVQKGIYLWNQVLYNEHKNLQIYQLQCIISEQFKEKRLKRQSYDFNKMDDSTIFVHGDSVLMAIASSIASELVFVINDSEDDILDNFSQILKLHEQPFFRIHILNFFTQFSPTVDQYRYFDKLNQASFNLIDDNKMTEQLQNWQNDLEMILEKKVYKDIEIDFLTFVSLLQIMTRKPIKELERLKNLDSLFDEATVRQITYEREYIEQTYNKDIREQCSQSDAITMDKFIQHILLFREQSLSLYQMQLNQFQNNESFEYQKQELIKCINKYEYDSILFNQELLDIDFSQKIQQLQKINKNKFQENYPILLGELLKLEECRGIKYNRLKEHIKQYYISQLYNFIIDFDKKQKDEQEQLNQPQILKQTNLLKERQEELLKGQEIIQNYIALMKKEVKTLQQFVEINSQINKEFIDILSQEKQILRLDEEILKLKDELNKKKKKN